MGRQSWSVSINMECPSNSDLLKQFAYLLSHQVHTAGPLPYTSWHSSIEAAAITAINRTAADDQAWYTKLHSETHQSDSVFQMSNPNIWILWPTFCKRGVLCKHPMTARDHNLSSQVPCSCSEPCQYQYGCRTNPMPVPHKLLLLPFRATCLCAICALERVTARLTYRYPNWAQSREL